MAASTEVLLKLRVILKCSVDGTVNLNHTSPLAYDTVPEEGASTPQLLVEAIVVEFTVLQDDPTVKAVAPQGSSLDRVLAGVSS